jgi:hypothetical protein
MQILGVHVEATRRISKIDAIKKHLLTICGGTSPLGSPALKFWFIAYMV